MKTLWVFLLFSLCFTPLPAAADPYALEETMPEGPFKGEVLNTTEKRAVVWLGSNRFANFYHQGRFWIASFTSDAVEDVIFQIEHWANAGPAAHVQLRFKLKSARPLQLETQDGEEGTGPEVHDVVISAEATYAQERSHTYSALLGLRRNYGITARAVSLAEKIDLMQRDRAFRIEQLRLDLTEERKNLLFGAALHLSSRMGHSEMYDTLRNSCTTFAFDVLDDTLSYHGWRRWMTRLDQIPLLSRYYLFSRGLVRAKGANQLPDLQEEVFGQWQTPAECEQAPEALSALGAVDPNRK